MCGIAGIFRFNGSPVTRTELERMNACLQERGPDGEGFWLKEKVGLSHRRLSIIDLSENGAQPMTDNSGTVVITYNGELYNYRELRQYLETVGMTFRTQSDTEVLLNGYRRWGIERLLEKTDGMFAFCIYDLRLNKAFLARDPFGKKPLYYSFTQQQLVFSSDIRAVAQQLENRTLNFHALDYYLSELSTTAEASIWEGVQQVSAGAFLEVELTKRVFRERSYFSTLPGPEQEISEADALEQTEILLRNAIRKRLVSDVPVGTFLSGGADSGLVTALLATESSEPVRTFSVGFAYEDHNELPYAQQLADRYRTQHTAIVVESNIEKDLPGLVNYFGEPFADSSALPSYYISREISKHVKVALSGDGGDELFGGYYEYPLAWQTETLLRENGGKFPGRAQLAANKVLSRLLPDVQNKGSLEHYFRLLSHERLSRQMGFSAEMKTKLLQPGVLEKTGRYAENFLTQQWNDAAAFFKKDALVQPLFHASLRTRLQLDYLVKVDRASMRNGLEVRSPFLDKTLSRFALSVPPAIRLKNGTAKYLLKKLAEKYIAPDFSKRPKMGFSLPMKHWLKKELKTFAYAQLLEGTIAKSPLFQPAYFKLLLDEHTSDKRDHTDRIWSLIVLNSWLEQNRIA